MLLASSIMKFVAASTSSLWGSFHLREGLIVLLILSCDWFCHGSLEPCKTKEMAVNRDYNSSKMHEGIYNASFRELSTSDLDPQCLHLYPMSFMGLSNICYRSNLFCLLLPPSSFLSGEHGVMEALLRSSYAGSSLKNKEKKLLESQKSNIINMVASPCSLPMLLEVYPHLLDWGRGYLHTPALAFLTVTNRQNDSVLQVHKPFSTDPQFYACNYSGSFLDPGEVASICFIFHPKQLGLSSAQLVIQTSIGGFLVQGKGFAAMPLIEDETSEIPGIPFGGWWSKILSHLGSLHMTVYAMDVKSGLPGSVLTLLKKIQRRLTVKKIYALSFLAVSLMFLKYYCTVPHLLPWIPKTYLFLGGNSPSTVSTVRNSPHVHQSNASGLSISYNLDMGRNSIIKSGSLVLECIDNTEHTVVATAERIVSQCAKSEAVKCCGGNISGESKEEESEAFPGKTSVALFKADNEDATDIGTIVVKVRKEKRRRKKGKGGRAGVAASFESPGSQSGYSTPSSPLSPITTVLLPIKSACYAKMEKSKKSQSPIKTLANNLSVRSVVLEASPNTNDMEHSVPKRVLDPAPKKTINKPFLFSSAPFAAVGHPEQNICPPYFLPRSSISPYARAPGPKHCKTGNYQASEQVAAVKEEPVDDFTYDIWGDHLFGFDRIGRLKEPSVMCLGNGNDSFSFFAKSPTLLGFHPRYVTTFDPKGK